MKKTTVDETLNPQIEEILKKNPTARVLEFIDGEWAIFKIPSRQVLGLAITKSRQNPLAMADVIIKNCLLGQSDGLTWEGDDGIGYVSGLLDKVDDIIGTKRAELKN